MEPEALAGARHLDGARGRLTPSPGCRGLSLPRCRAFLSGRGGFMRHSEHGRIGYLVLYLLGAPIGLLLLLWVLLGNNLIGPG